MTSAARGHEHLAALRAPFTPAALRFKVQAGGGTRTDPKPALVVAYIDARTVVARLNYVCGLDWSDAYRWEGQSLVCALTVLGTTRYDVGEPGKGKQQASPKALYSDALKRAAVRFGVAESVYAIPKMWTAERGECKYNPEGKAEGLTDAAVARLRDVYSVWLREHGEAAFGKAIDHGDAVDAAGDYEAEGEEQPAQARAQDAPLVSQAQVDRLYAIGGENAYVANALTTGVSLADALRNMAGWVTRDDDDGPVTSLHQLTRSQYDRVSRTIDAMAASGQSAGRATAAISEWVAERSGQPAPEPESELPADLPAGSADLDMFPAR